MNKPLLLLVAGIMMSGGVFAAEELSDPCYNVIGHGSALDTGLCSAITASVPSSNPYQPPYPCADHQQLELFTGGAKTTGCPLGTPQSGGSAENEPLKPPDDEQPSGATTSGDQPPSTEGSLFSP